MSKTKSLYEIDGIGNPAMRTVVTTGDNYGNTPSLYTIDDNGNPAMRVSGGGGGGGSTNASSVSVINTLWEMLAGTNVQSVMNNLDILLRSLSIGSAQGTFTYYGTKSEVEGVSDATSGDTAVAWESPNLYRGDFNGVTWTWVLASPAPTNGMWAFIQDVVLQNNKSGMMLIVDDGVRPMRVDTMIFGLPTLQSYKTEPEAQAASIADPEGFYTYPV